MVVVELASIDVRAVGARIKLIRNELGLTAKELGAKIDAPQSAVANWERGANLPNPKRIGAIAKIGGVSVSDLLFGKRRKIYAITKTTVGAIVENTKVLTKCYGSLTVAEAARRRLIEETNYDDYYNFDIVEMEVVE